MNVSDRDWISSDGMDSRKKASSSASTVSLLPSLQPPPSFLSFLSSIPLTLPLYLPDRSLHPSTSLLLFLRSSLSPSSSLQLQLQPKRLLLQHLPRFLRELLPFLLLRLRKPWSSRNPDSRLRSSSTSSLSLARSRPCSAQEVYESRSYRFGSWRRRRTGKQDGSQGEEESDSYQTGSSTGCSRDGR